MEWINHTGIATRIEQTRHIIDNSNMIVQYDLVLSWTYLICTLHDLAPVTPQYQ